MDTPAGSARKKRREPPILVGEDRKEKLALWMEGGRAVSLKVPSTEGLTIAQLAQYSVLRERGAWREVRDELSGDVFYIQTPEMKTTWSAQHTPFKQSGRQAPAGKLTRTAREAKLAKWEALLKRSNAHSTHGGHTHPTDAESTASNDPCDTLTWLPEPYTPRRHNTLLLCPYTGVYLPAGTFTQRAPSRKRAVADLFQGDGIPASEIIFTDVSADPTDFTQQDQYNEQSRQVFETLIANVLSWVIDAEGPWAVRTLKRQFDALVADLDEEQEPAPPSPTSSIIHTQAPAFPKAGDRVRQHPTNWAWGDTETGAQPGVVLHAFPVTGYVTVKWKTKYVGTYKWPEELLPVL